VRVESTAGLPDGHFLAVGSVPCPAGQTNRGGVGGAMMTACTWCGDVAGSTAGRRHDGPMLILVVAEKARDHTGMPLLLVRSARPEDMTHDNKDGE